MTECDKSHTQLTNVRRQICCIRLVSGSRMKFCTPIKHTFTFFRLLWPAVFISWKLFCFFVYLNILTQISRKWLTAPLTFLQYWSNLLYRDYIKIIGPCPSLPPRPIKLTAQFHVLLVKIFSLKLNSFS